MESIRLRDAGRFRIFFPAFLAWCSWATAVMAQAPATLPTPNRLEANPAPAPLAVPKTEGGPEHPLPIDLPYALRLVNASNPTIAIAQERINEAYARLRQAQVLWLPNLWVGGNPDNVSFLPMFYHHDGNIQSSRGEVFPVTKNNFAFPFGTSLNFQVGDALFGPRIRRNLVAAEAARARVVVNNVQLDVALTYLDLLRGYAALAVNAETLKKAEQMQSYAVAAERQGLGKTTADAPRAETEVRLRREERFQFIGQAASVSARLAQLLLLEPTADLVPTDGAVLPIELVPGTIPIEELVATGLMNRPELAESRSLVEASLARWRQSRTRPLLPTLSVVYYGADFAGGSDLFTGSTGLSHWGGRDDFMAQASWELKNLGFGDLARSREARSQYSQARFRVAEVQAQVAAEVSAAAKIVRARLQALKSAEDAVRHAEEMWARLLKAAFGLAVEARKYDPLEPLIAEQQLNEARMRYLDAVIGYNRDEFRLYWAMGQPPESALSKSNPQPVETPVLPSQSSPPTSLKNK
jgi:outer membrane protein TolC